MHANKLAILVRSLSAVGILAAGVGGYRFLAATAPQMAEQAEQARAPWPLPVFEAAKVPVRREYRGFGEVIAHRAAEVSAEVAGRVLEKPEGIEAGAAVEAGTRLVRLDDRDAARRLERLAAGRREIEAEQASLEVEAAELEDRLELERRERELAATEWRRLRELRGRGAGNAREVDAAERAYIQARYAVLATERQIAMLPSRRQGLQARLDALEADIALARLERERARITSPFAGVIESVSVDAGAFLAAGSRVAEVVAAGRVEVVLHLPGAARGEVAAGRPVTLERVGGGEGGGPSFTAPIDRIGPVAAGVSRTFPVYLTLHEPPADLAPGAAVSGTVTGDRAVERFVVPRRSLLEGRVRVVREGRVVSVPAAIDFSLARRFERFGLPDRQWVALAPGVELEPGDRVVLEASAELPDGRRVAPVAAGGKAP